MSKLIISLPRRLNITIQQLSSVFLKSCDNIRWVEVVLFVALKSARSYSFEFQNIVLHREAAGERLSY